VFQCYLDDSGTSGLPIVTLGGFVAHMSHWERLEPLVDAIMIREGIDVFHAKQFQDTDTPFKGWEKRRKLEFADTVFSTCQGSLQGIAIAIGRESFEQGRKRNPKQFSRSSVMGSCFVAIMIKLITHLQLGPVIKEHGISFLLESGNVNNSEIEKRFGELAKMPVFEGALRSISFIPKSHCRAIQLADFFVFYSRRQLSKDYKSKGRIIIPECPYLATMKRYGPIHHDLGMGEIKSTGSKLGVELKNLSDLSALVRKNPNS